VKRISFSVYSVSMDGQRLRLRDARLAAGLTQRELAERLGVEQPHIARWESGRQEPLVGMALRIAQALDTTVEALWMPPTEKRGRAPR
jgi:putative transcriptional regulator